MKIDTNTIEADTFKALTYAQCIEIFGQDTFYLYEAEGVDYIINSDGMQRVERATITSTVKGATLGIAHALGGFIDPSKRLDICKTCPLFENNRCRKCGCFLQAKARIKNEKCPEGKW